MTNSLTHARRISWFTAAVAILASLLMAFGAAGASAAQPASSASAADYIVQLAPGTSTQIGRKWAAAHGGRVRSELHVIRALVVRMTAAQAARVRSNPAFKAVSRNAAVRTSTLVNFDPTKMATSYNQSAASSNLWTAATGRGVGVAVIDTGIAGDLPDFRTSQTNSASRVIASVVTNPLATNAGDTYGHGTHVAGIIAGNSGYRPSTDKLRGLYAGSAPDANLISIKADDGNGNATVLDVIYGIQFAVDNKAAYNIRVINLSVESTTPQSYKTDPLDAAVESAWFSGIVVVAAAGNRGSAADSASYAPGNDPYIISVGAVDDKKTKDTKDDSATTWSARGVTQDGFVKPDVYAPGAHIISSLAPASAFTALCPGCIKSDGQYIQAGGTSMAAPVVSGIVAAILEKRPTWTPDMVKGALINTTRSLSGGTVREVNALSAYNASTDKLKSNAGLTPNPLVSTATGAIDYTRSSWSRSSWSGVDGGPLDALWARSSWSCNCSKTSTGSIDPTRSSWSRGSWSTSWAY